MAADLSLLFQPQQPAGAMAGYQQGITNARSLMDLEKLGTDTRTAEFELDKNRQMLPYDLQVKMGQGAQGKQDSSTEALALRMRGKQGEADSSYAKGKEALLKLDTTQLEEIVKQQKTRMMDIMDKAVVMGSQGMSGAQLMPMFDDMMRNLPKEQQVEWQNQRMWLERLSPEQVVSEATKHKQALWNTSDASMLESLKGAVELEKARITSESNERTAGIKAATDGGDKNASYQQEIVRLTRELANLKPGDPRRATLEAHVKYLEEKDLARLSSSTSYDLDQFRTRKEAGTGASPAKVFQYDKNGNRIK